MSVFVPLANWRTLKNIKNILDFILRNVLCCVLVGAETYRQRDSA